VKGAIVRTEVTLGKGGWHVHLHLILKGGYWPQAGLSDEWRVATRGEGYVVHIEQAYGSMGNVVSELAKYAAKPMAEDGSSLENWPVELRRELAGWLDGKLRTRKVEGGYQIERTGRRLLCYYGRLKGSHREARASRPEVDPNLCPKCKAGTMVSESEYIERLQSIPGHNSTSDGAPPLAVMVQNGSVGAHEGESGPPSGGGLCLPLMVFGPVVQREPDIDDPEDIAVLVRARHKSRDEDR
jgi:hypothetical protein